MEFPELVDQRYSGTLRLFGHKDSPHLAVLGPTCSSTWPPSQSCLPPMAWNPWAPSRPLLCSSCYGYPQLVVSVLWAWCDLPRSRLVSRSGDHTQVDMGRSLASSLRVAGTTGMETGGEGEVTEGFSLSSDQPCHPFAFLPSWVGTTPGTFLLKVEHSSM